MAPWELSDNDDDNDDDDGLAGETSFASRQTNRQTPVDGQTDKPAIVQYSLWSGSSDSYLTGESIVGKLAGDADDDIGCFPERHGTIVSVLISEEFITLIVFIFTLDDAKKSQLFYQMNFK